MGRSQRDGVQERPVRRIKGKGGEVRGKKRRKVPRRDRGGNRHKEKDDDGTQGNKHGRKGEQGAHPEPAAPEIQLSLSLF